jgi:aminopeptidase N
MNRRANLITGLALVAVVLTTTAATSVFDTYPRQPGIDAIHYSFRVTLRDDSDTITGETTVDFRFVQSGITTLFLDLTSASEATEGKGMRVLNVTSDAGEVRWVHEGDRLSMTLDAAPPVGERRRFTVTYEGVPATGLRIGPNSFGERTFFSTNWPNKARQWLPMIDHPYDKATSEFVITAPSHYQVVANGLLQEETDLGNGWRVTHWKQGVPIASWLNAVGVARFASRHFGTVRGIPLQTWVFPEQRDEGVVTFEIPVRQAMEFFSEHIGEYAYEKLANVAAAGMGGGMEHASVIFYGERSVRMQPATGLVAHEIAHQWFGNSVTESDWDDVWLSEGFATYFTLLTTEHYRGRDAFVAGLESSRDRVFSMEESSPGRTVVHDNLADMGRVLSGLQYQKGGWVLHMLRREIGTETFWAGIREYYARYRDGNASTDDLRRVMEEQSGQELSWFFDQWLTRSTSPAIDGTWRYEAAARRVVVELRQTQAGDPYRLHLELGITAGDGTTGVEAIAMTQKRQRFEIAVEGEPETVVLDPNTWALIKGVVRRQS